MPTEWPVLVTGAGGFVGGHVARELARAGHPVRGLVRRPPRVREDDPPIDWRSADLLEPESLLPAVKGARAILHCAGWVSLGPDDSGLAWRVNVDGTRSLLDAAESSGVERFVFTSTLHTIAAGTAEVPADETTPWNLEVVESPYNASKRAAESLVLERSRPGMACLALCPAMVLGPRDETPTSTEIVRKLLQRRLVILPGGGIPIVDVAVVAEAQRKALEHGEGGHRYVLAGAYLSYPDLAKLLRDMTGRPRWIFEMADLFERPLLQLFALGRAMWPRLGEVTPALISGAFLRLHVSGALADSVFELSHPSPIETLRRLTDDLGIGANP